MNADGTHILGPHAVLVAAACLCFLGGGLRKGLRVWGGVALLAIGGAAAWLIGAVVMGGGEAVDAALAPVVRDRLAVLIQLMCLGTGGLLALAALERQSRSNTGAEFFGLFLLVLTGAMLVACANDLIIFYLALELIAIPLTLLLFISRDDVVAQEGALKHFLLGLVASAVLLYGFSLLYGLGGCTNLTVIREVLTESYRPGELRTAIGSGSVLGGVAVVLIFVGAGFRMALVPFHFERPEAAQGSTAWHAGLLAVVPVVTGFVVLVRVLAESMVGFERTGMFVAVALAIISMSLANGMAFLQSRIRPLLAYTTIVHAGFLLIALAVGLHDAGSSVDGLPGTGVLPRGVQAGVFYLGIYVLAATGLFVALAYLARAERQMEYVDDLRGLVKHEPLAAIVAGIFLLTLAGMPPLPGFWGRFMVFGSALNVPAEAARSAVVGPHALFVVLACVALANLVILAAVYLRVLATMFFNEPIARPRPAGGQPALAAALIAAFLTVGVGLLPGPVLDSFDERIKREARHASDAVGSRKDDASIISAGHAKTSSAERRGTSRLP